MATDRRHGSGSLSSLAGNRRSECSGSEGRDEKDFERLRHARDRQVGFPVGQYLQPPPMLFTRDGHNVFLGDVYRGEAAFLVCAGPSLADHDLSLLDRRGVLTLAVNNAAAVYRPRLWCSVDDPGNFCEAIWYDPGILKFVPLCHMEKTFMVRDTGEELVPSAERVGDMPAVFGYRRNETFDAQRWLYEDTFNWGNHSRRVDAYGNKGSRSVMYVALRLLFYLGVRRVYLIGCDFRMRDGARNYAFAQDRSRAAVRGNNNSYRILDVRLKHLKPHFERAGFEVLNCTPDSGLTAFPHVPFERAVEEARGKMPERINTAGMYDRRQREKDREKAPGGETPRSRPSPPAEVDWSRVPPLTLIVPLDAQGAEVLPLTWASWAAAHPPLREMPTVVVHDPRLDAAVALPESLACSERLECVPAWAPDAEPAGDAMQRALIRAAAERVATPWYVQLAPEAIASRGGIWPQPEWFAPDQEGREPVFVASPWGYTKPARAIERLDRWADGTAPLKDHPPLELPFDPASDRIRHATISPWCFLGRTDWVRRADRWLEGGLPIPDGGTCLHYCAVRLGEFFRRVPMKNFGWEHSFGFKPGRIRRRCRALLGTKGPAAAGR